MVGITQYLMIKVKFIMTWTTVILIVLGKKEGNKAGIRRTDGEVRRRWIGTGQRKMKWKKPKIKIGV